MILIKRILFLLTCVLTATLTSCSQNDEQTEAGAGSKKGSLPFSFAENKTANTASNITSRSETEAEFLTTDPEEERVERRLRKQEKKQQREIEKDLLRAKKQQKRAEERIQQGRPPRVAPTPHTEAQRQELLEQRAVTDAEEQEQARENIDSEDDSKRLEAIRDLDPTKPGDFKLLLNALKTDPDPAIRQKVAEMFSFGKAPGAIPALINSLADSEPKVIVSAIESLSWHDKDNNDIINAIEDLKTHKDSRVKEAAEEALEILIK